MSKEYSGMYASKWYVMILLAVVFAVYGNTLLNGYAMDDATVVYDNSIVKKGLAGIPELLTTPRLSGYLKLQADSYRPVSLVLFAAEYELWGANPMAGHMVTVLLFAVCVLLFYSLLRRLQNMQGWVPFVAALLFAVHPIHTEVVANIKSCDELLAFGLGFGALHLYLTYARNGKLLQLVAGTMLYLLACLSKETVITFVVLIPIVFFLYEQAHKRRSVAITATTAGAAILFLLISRAVLAANNAAMQGAEDFTTNAMQQVPVLATRIPTALLVLGKYLLLLVVPYPLLCNYSYSSIPFVGWGNVWVLLSLVIYATLAVVVVLRLMHKSKDTWALAILFFLITLSLFSNIFFLVTSQMAERFLFLPSAGFCIAVALGISRLSREENTTLPKKTLLLLTPILLVFGGMTIARNRDWKDDATLFAADLKKSPDDCKLNYYRAISIPVDATADKAAQQKVLVEKMGYLQRALAIYPEFLEAHTEVAKIYEVTGRYDSALAHNLLVLRINRGNSIASYHAANEYYAMGKREQAILWYKATIELEPYYKPAYLNIAKCYADIMIPDSAVAYYRALMNMGEQPAMVYRGVAMCFMQLSRFDSAAAYMKQVVMREPGNPDDVNNLGAMYLSAGRYDEAIALFRQTVLQNPAYKVAYTNIAVAHDKAGRKDSAAFYRALGQ
jgi:protein O-mannosyl-transferase